MRWQVNGWVSDVCKVLYVEEYKLITRPKPTKQKRGGGWGEESELIAQPGLSKLPLRDWPGAPSCHALSSAHQDLQDPVCVYMYMTDGVKTLNFPLEHIIMSIQYFSQK